MKKLLLVAALIILFLNASCKTHFTVAYAIETQDRTFYCNHPQFINDTVRGAELKRNGTIRNVFEVPYGSVKSVTFDGKKYPWK